MRGKAAYSTNKLAKLDIYHKKSEFRFNLSSCTKINSNASKILSDQRDTYTSMNIAALSTISRYGIGLDVYQLMNR